MVKYNLVKNKFTSILLKKFYKYTTISITVLLGISLSWFFTVAQTWQMSGSRPPDNATLEAVIPPPGDNMGLNEHTATTNLYLSDSYRLYNIDSDDAGTAMTVNAGAAGFNLYSGSSYGIYVDGNNPGPAVTASNVGDFGLIAETGAANSIAAALQGDLLVSEGLQLGGFANNLLSTELPQGSGGPASSNLYWQDRLLCDVSLPNCGWILAGSAGDGLGSHIAEAGVNMYDNRIYNAYSSSDSLAAVAATSTLDVISAQFLSNSGHGIQASSNGLDANNSAGFYAYAYAPGVALVGQSWNGYGAKFTGDLQLMNNSGSSINAALQYDFEDNNALNVTPADYGAPTKDLYWGDKLICDVSEPDCGWLASSVLGLWLANANGIHFPDSGSSKVLISDTRSDARLSVGFGYTPTTEDASNYYISNLATIPGASRDLQVVGYTAYIVSDSGLTTVDVTDPSSPVLLSNLAGFDAWDVQVVNNIAYVASMSGLQIIDVRDPNDLILLGTYPYTAEANSDNTYMTGVRVGGQYAYVYYNLSSNARLLTLDISDPAVPVMTSELSMQSQTDPRDMEIGYGRLILAVGQEGLRLYDIATDPSNPAFIVKDTSGDSKPVTTVTLWRDLISGNLMAAAVSEDVFIYDISADTLNQVGRTGQSGLAGNDAGTFDIQAYGRYLIYSKSKIKALDVLDPTNPDEVQWFFTSFIPGTFNIRKMYIDGKYIYGTDFTQDLQILRDGGLVVSTALANDVAVNQWNVDHNLSVGQATALGLYSGQYGLQIGGQLLMGAGSELVLGSEDQDKLDQQKLINIKTKAGL